MLLGHGARDTEHTLIHIGVHHVPGGAYYLGCQAGDHAGATGHLKHPLSTLERRQRHDLLVGGYERGDDIPFMHLRGCASHLPSRGFTHTRSFLYAEQEDCTPYLADFLGEAAVFLQPNARRQLLPEAAAQRRLEAVSCTP